MHLAPVVRTRHSVLSDVAAPVARACKRDIVRHVAAGSPRFERWVHRRPRTDQIVAVRTWFDGRGTDVVGLGGEGHELVDAVTDVDLDRRLGCGDEVEHGVGDCGRVDNRGIEHLDHRGVRP
jgi:hypothetical protein